MRPSDRHLENLFARTPALMPIKQDLCAVFEQLKNAFVRGNRLYLCGNGGSCADAEHIAGELMKGFFKKRRVSASEAQALAAAGDGGFLAQHLQGALPAIPLSGMLALSTAVINDIDGSLVYAQQLWGLGRPGDVLLAISTSGNAKNIVQAAVVARARGMKVIGMTGATGGALLLHCDLCLRVPANETYLVQELHLPLYHALCGMLEADLFDEEGGA